MVIFWIIKHDSHIFLFKGETWFLSFTKHWISRDEFYSSKKKVYSWLIHRFKNTIPMRNKRSQLIKSFLFAPDLMLFLFISLFFVHPPPPQITFDKSSSWPKTVFGATNASQWFAWWDKWICRSIIMWTLKGIKPQSFKTRRECADQWVISNPLKKVSYKYLKIVFKFSIRQLFKDSLINKLGTLQQHLSKIPYRHEPTLSHYYYNKKDPPTTT